MRLIMESAVEIFTAPGYEPTWRGLSHGNRSMIAMSRSGGGGKISCAWNVQKMRAKNI